MTEIKPAPRAIKRKMDLRRPATTISLAYDVRRHPAKRGMIQRNFSLAQWSADSVPDVTTLTAPWSGGDGISES
jgi:hypothetical protein